MTLTLKICTRTSSCWGDSVIPELWQTDMTVYKPPDAILPFPLPKWCFIHQKYRFLLLSLISLLKQWLWDSAIKIQACSLRRPAPLPSALDPPASCSPPTAARPGTELRGSGFCLPSSKQVGQCSKCQNTHWKHVCCRGPSVSVQRITRSILRSCACVDKDGAPVTRLNHQLQVPRLYRQGHDKLGWF